MIKKFKTKEQLQKEQICELAEDFNEVMKAKAIRILSGKTQKDDRLFYSNLLVKSKFDLRKAYIKLEEYYEDKREIKFELEYCTDINLKNSLIKCKDSLDDCIKNYKDFILSHGEFLINCILPMINKYFSEHEIVQLVGGSEIAAKEYKETMEELNLQGCKDEDGGFAFDFIYYHGEYRWRKGRAKDFIDCPDWEMPLFNAISECILHEMKNNPTLKQETDVMFEEMFADALMYATLDENGNIINVEKINQEITVRELLLNYKDLQPKGIISKIKKGSVIDMNKKLKLHKNEENNYTVFDLGENKLGNVYKLEEEGEK